MNLFIDEDTGPNIGKALRLVKAQVQWVGGKNARFPFGTKDPVWLSYVGDNGLLALSHDTAILQAETEREILISRKVGIVFLPQVKSLEVLRLIMNKWQWLEKIDRDEPRPFAFRISPSGRSKRLPLEAPLEEPALLF